MKTLIAAGAAALVLGGTAATVPLLTSAGAGGPGTLPDTAADAAVAAVAEAGKPEAGEPEAAPSANPRREAAMAFVAAKKAWTKCVAEAAAGHGGTAFDPVEACGERPTAPNSKPETAPAVEPGVPDDVTTGRPEGVPSGKPSELPAPPVEVPSAPPADAGPPEGVPAGPPTERPGRP